MLSGIGYMSRYTFLPTHESIGQKPSDTSDEASWEGYDDVVGRWGLPSPAESHSKLGERYLESFQRPGYLIIREPSSTVYSRCGPIMVLNGKRTVIFALDKVRYSAPNLEFD